MATLEKIRSKGVLLIIIIGLALLAFIVGDFLNNSSSWFRQSKQNIAEINGKTVKIQDYQTLVEQLTEVYKIEYNIPSIDENTTAQIRQNVWESLLKNTLLSSETEKIGLAVSSKEVEDQTIGNNPNQLVQGRHIFANPKTGMFDKNRLIGFLSELNKKPTNPQEQEQFEKYKNYWMYFENLIKSSKLEEKYTTLLSKALNANSIEAKLAFESQKNTVDLLYVVKPYSSIPDDKVKVSDQEIAAKYEQIKERYKQEKNRDIKYVSFNLIPSKEDFAKAQDWINKLKVEFATTSDVASVVNPNSKPYKDIALSAKDIDSDLKSFAFSGKKNDMFGPMLFGNKLKMARIMDTGISAPDSIKIKHIVVSVKDEAKTKILADSIMGALKGGADFAALAMKYSQMEQTASKGGEVGWMPVASIEPKIANACLVQPINVNFTYQDGKAIQIIQVTERTANRNKVKLAVIENEVTPSQETYSKIYNEAKQFAGEFNTLQKFEKGAQKKGYVVQPALGVEENAPKIADIKNSRQIIKWAFETEAGKVSDVYDCEKQFVVAAIVAANEKGYKPVLSVTPEIKSMLIPDKKAELIIADLKSKNTSDLNALVTQLVAKVDSAKQINFESSTFGAAGYEPEVIVYSTLKAEINKVSEPIKGKQGIYVVKAFNKFTNPAMFDAKTQKTSLGMRYMNVAYGATEALKDKADIEDNRSRFY